MYKYMCTYSLLTEALWQPARKSTVNENRRPIYVFSTDLANSAADAVLKNRYDTIIQFHNAQPKGPGFLRLLKDNLKRDTNSVQKTSDVEDERDGTGRAPKRRSSRLSTSDETPTSKKLRSGGQTKMSDDSKNSRTRFSRRIRKQKQTSSSPPSSPTSDHSDSGSQPSPVPYRGRGRSNRGAGRRAGRGRGRGGRDSPLVNSGRQRRAVEGEQDEDSEEEDEEQDDDREEDGQMDDSRDADKEEAAEDGEDDDNRAKRPPETYSGGPDMSPRESAPSLDTQTSSQQPVVEDEDNYTICHGTPRTKGSRTADISSPVPKLPPQTHLAKSTAVGSPSGTSSPSVSHPTQHDIASLGIVEKSPKQQLSSNTSAALGGSRPQDPMLGHHPAPDMHKETAAANNWPVGPQFSHIPSGYYSAGIHPMHYPPHATQHVPGNYPYSVYPWPHHPVGQPTREQHPYATHENVAQHTSRSTASSQSGHLSASHPTSHVAYQHHTHSAPTETGKELNSAGSQGHESGSAVMKPPSHEKHSAQSHLAHSHSALHQLSGPGSTQATALSQVHHAFPRPPHALTTEQISAVHHPAAAAFPYGFDPSNPAALSHMHHLWQQQQHQIRAAGVHPSHLSPHLQHPAAAGMWYAPHMQQLMHGGIADESAKRRAVAAQAAGSKHPQVDTSALRMNSNRNNNTTGTLHLEQVHTQTGQQSGVHSTILRGETNYISSPQAVDWTSNTQFTSGSFP